MSRACKKDPTYPRHKNQSGVRQVYLSMMHAKQSSYNHSPTNLCVGCQIDRCYCHVVVQISFFQACYSTRIGFHSVCRFIQKQEVSSSPVAVRRWSQPRVPTENNVIVKNIRIQTGICSIYCNGDFCHLLQVVSRLSRKYISLICRRQTYQLEIGEFRTKTITQSCCSIAVPVGLTLTRSR